MEICLKVGLSIQGSETLAEVAERLRAEAESVLRLEGAGFHLAQMVDDYDFYIHDDSPGDGDHEALGD